MICADDTCALADEYPVAGALGFMPNGEVKIHLSPVTNFAAGNAEFFTAGIQRPVQLRPLLSSDVGPHGMGRRANALLWVRDDEHRCYVAVYVRVPPHIRKNNRPGVMRAVRYVEKEYCSRGYAPHVAKLLTPHVARSDWSAAST